MKPDLFKLKELLLLFKLELADHISFTQIYNPKNDQDDFISPWQKDEAYSLIFLETNYHFFWGMSEKTKPRLTHYPYPDYLLQHAKIFYDNWGMKTIQVKGCPTKIPKIKEINKYKQYGIPKPLDHETLIAYIERIRSLITNKLYSKKLWVESLGSFLEFVRANIPAECHGFIEIVFPMDKTFYSDTIIRLIQKVKFPTNILYIASILKELSHKILWGDQKTQHGACEALAYAWLCLISARLQFPTELKLLYEFDLTTLTTEDNSENILFPKKYFLGLPTLFGNIKMEITKLQHQYFCHLAEINQKMGSKNHFFTLAKNTLEKNLKRAVGHLQLPPEHGDITFQTLTSWPTENLHHRTQIDNSRYRTRHNEA
jgi:hypothetical protein